MGYYRLQCTFRDDASPEEARLAAFLKGRARRHEWVREALLAYHRTQGGPPLPLASPASCAPPSESVPSQTRPSESAPSQTPLKKKTRGAQEGAFESPAKPSAQSVPVTSGALQRGLNPRLFD
jgi:hypothetical protein